MQFFIHIISSVILFAKNVRKFYFSSQCYDRLGQWDKLEKVSASRLDGAQPGEVLTRSDIWEDITYQVCGIYRIFARKWMIRFVRSCLFKSASTANEIDSLLSSKILTLNLLAFVVK